MNYLTAFAPALESIVDEFNGFFIDKLSIGNRQLGEHRYAVMACNLHHLEKSTQTEISSITIGILAWYHDCWIDLCNIEASEDSINVRVYDVAKLNTDASYAALLASSSLSSFSTRTKSACTFKLDWCDPDILNDLKQLMFNL